VVQVDWIKTFLKPTQIPVGQEQLS
jgi:hypothetical protein